MKIFKTLTEANEFILSMDNVAYATRVSAMQDLKNKSAGVVKGIIIFILIDEQGLLDDSNLRQSLLAEARLKYPIGTTIKTYKGELVLITQDMRIDYGSTDKTRDDIYLFMSKSTMGDYSIYGAMSKEWAPIVEPANTMRSIELSDFGVLLDEEGFYSLVLSDNIIAYISKQTNNLYALDIQVDGSGYLITQSITLDTALCILNSVWVHLGETHPTEELDHNLIRKLNLPVLRGDKEKSTAPKGWKDLDNPQL